jgi:hypothetical protein
VALSIEILVALANVTISEGTCVTSNNNTNNDDDSSISIYNNSSVSSGGVGGGGGGGGSGNDVGMVAAMVVLWIVAFDVVA